MRSVLVFVFTLLMCYSSTYGQADRYEPGVFFVGIKGGLNATAMAPQHNYGQALLDYKVPIRPLAGLSLMYQVGIRSQIMIEAGYQVMGQNHETFAKRTDFVRNTKQQYLVFPILYKLILNKPEGRYGTAATYYNTHWYLVAGVQPGILLASDIRYEVNGTETDFLSFITEGGNPNIDQIEAMTPPANDEDLYNDFDLSLTGGAGLFRRISSRWQIFAEIRGGFSVLDVNIEEWRLPAGSGNYFGTYNMFIGVQAGMAYRIF